MRLIKKIPRKMTLDAFANEIMTNGYYEFFKKWNNQTFAIIGPIPWESPWVEGYSLRGVSWNRRYGVSIHGRKEYCRKEYDDRVYKVYKLSMFSLHCLCEKYPHFYDVFGFNYELLMNYVYQNADLVCVFSSHPSELDNITIDDVCLVEVKGILSAVTEWADSYDPRYDHRWVAKFILTNCRITAFYDKDGNKKQ